MGRIGRQQKESNQHGSCIPLTDQCDELGPWPANLRVGYSRAQERLLYLHLKHVR